MTTHTYSAVVDHSSDAGFRAWGAALSAGLTAAGLVQTADTGQINWVTVTRPISNTVGGYEIWRLPDSSLYFKIEYGTATGATAPQGWVTVGSGSSGAGSIIGQSSTRSTFFFSVAPSSTSTSYVSYVAVNDHGLFLCWALNGFSSGAAPGGFLMVCKTCDTSGGPTTDGFGVLRLSGGYSLQAVRLAAAAATGADSIHFCIVPGSPSSSLAGGANQAWPVWMSIPDMRLFLGAVVYVATELSEAVTFSLTPIGSTARTFLALGQIGTTGPANAGVATYGLAMLWE